MKRYSLAKLHKRLWKLISEYVRRKNADANGYVRCISCGTIHHWKKVDCGHLVSRTHWYTRYLETNLAEQCKGCNAFKQGAYTAFREGMVRRWGEETIKQVEERRNWPSGYTVDGLLLRIEKYRQKLKEMNCEMKNEN